jgi:hypothetical protein
VACGVADVLQVVVLAPGAHAFLRRRGAAVAALVEAEEHILELVHARVGEQQGRIVVRHQGTGGNDLMALGGEKVEELLADFGAFHGGDTAWDAKRRFYANRARATARRHVPARKHEKARAGRAFEAAAESAIARGTILATVMIAIVLAVVLFLGNVAALRRSAPARCGRAPFWSPCHPPWPCLPWPAHAPGPFPACGFLRGQLAGRTPWSMRFCCSA